MPLIDEMRRLRSEDWPLIVRIEGPPRPGNSYIGKFFDADGEMMGETIEFRAKSQEEAMTIVSHARSRMRR